MSEACDADLPALQGGYRPLSKDELSHTYEALLGASRWAALAPTWEQFVPETGAFSARDVLYNEGQAAALFELAARAAEMIADDAAQRVEVVGACADSANPDRACIESFVGKFGARALRRPVEQEEIARFADAYESDEPDLALKVLLGRLLSAPAAVFLSESLGEASADRAVLDPYEVAARISFATTQAPPDDALRAAAESGELATPDDLRREVIRLLDTDAGAETVRAFFSSWLELDAQPQPHVRNIALHDLPETDLRGELREETLQFAAYVVQSGGGLSQFLSEDRVFPSTPALAAIYGTEVSSKAVRPPEPRPGIFLRAAMFAEGTVGTSPILRGAHLQERLLCTEFPPPPAAAVSARLNEVQLDPLTMTRRQIAEELTSPDQCGGCHRQINPVGFVFERFDGLGMRRDEEKVLDDAGNVIASLPLDVRVEQVTVAGVGPVDLDGPEDFAAFIAANPEPVAQCFARKLLEFTQRRSVVPADRCLIAEVAQVLRDGGTLHEALVAALANPATLYRSTEMSSP